MHVIRVLMCVSVNLDYKPCLNRREIGDVRPNRVLSPKLNPKLASAQVLPQSTLDARGVDAHVLGERDLRIVHDAQDQR